MWIRKLKKKKMQYIVIGLILACITAIFTGCLSFALGIGEFTDSYYSKDKLPEFYFSIVGEEGKESIEAFADESQAFQQLFLQQGRKFKGKLEINDNTISLLQTDFMAVSDVDQLPFDVRANKGISNLKQPEKGTVWVSSVFADLKKIKPGDQMVLQGKNTHTLTIAGTYNSAICPSASLAFYPFYVNEEELAVLSDLEVVYYGCFTREDKDQPLEEFILPKAFTSSIQIQYDLDALRLSLKSATLIVVGIGIAASVLIFFVSIIIIRFIIKSNLAKEYKSIGVYKALGFTSREIIGFYLNCYLLTGVISVTIGAVLGLPLANYLGSMSTRYLGNFHMGSQVLGVGLLAVCVLLLLLVMNLGLSLRKIKRISPVKALNMEMVSSRSKLKKSLIKHAHSPLSMALNDIFKRKGTSFMIMLILTVAFYLSIFFMMTNYTGQHLSENTATWFGVPNTRCFVNIPIDEETKQLIEDSEYVDQVSYGQLYQLLSIEVNDRKADLSNCTIHSYSSFDEDLTEVNYLEGRAPKGKNELALTLGVMNNLNAQVGDYVNLNINDVSKDYLIVGKYNAMMNGGYIIQIPNAALDACNVPYVNDIAFVKLKDEADYQSFKTYIEKNIAYANVTNKLESLGDATKSVTEIIVPITSLMVIIFICFGFLNIVNLLLLNNIDNRKKFGILKALGFTNGYIMVQNIFRILILSLGSIILALAIHVCVSAKLFEMMIAIDGLLYNIPLMAALIGGMLILILVTAVIFTLPLRNITPTDLMEE